MREGFHDNLGENALKRHSPSFAKLKSKYLKYRVFFLFFLNLHFKNQVTEKDANRTIQTIMDGHFLSLEGGKEIHCLFFLHFSEQNEDNHRILQACLSVRQDFPWHSSLGRLCPQGSSPRRMGPAA